MKTKRMLAILLCLAFCLSLPAVAANTPVRVVESNGIFTVINDSGNDYEVTAFFSAYSTEGQLCGVELVPGFTHLPAGGAYSAVPNIAGDRVKLIVLEAGTFLPLTGEPLTIEKLAADELTDIAIQTLDAIADYATARPDDTGYSFTARTVSATAGQAFTDLLAALLSAGETCPALGGYCVGGYAVTEATDAAVRACLAELDLKDTDGNPIVFSSPMTDLCGKTVKLTLFSGSNIRYEYLLNFGAETGSAPETGRGIAGMAFNEAGELIVTYTDGTTENLGRIPGTGGNTEPEEPEEPDVPDVPEEPEEPDGDDTEITYVEAVNVMSNLGIMPGYGDGSFHPNGNVTRAQAAKILATVMLKTANAAGIPAPTSIPFVDVKNGNWYATYVGYCAAMGVIPDDGDGCFRPDSPVTGIELARMLLLALGYGRADEYVGSGWDIRVVTDAFAVGLFDGSRADDFAAPVTREECALYVYNALLNCRLVTYDAEHSAYAVNTTTYAEKVWNLRMGTGILMANTATGSGSSEILMDGDSWMIAFDIETPLSLIGHEVQILYEDVRNDKGVYTNVYAVTDVTDVMTAQAVTAAKLTGTAIIPWSNYVAGIAVTTVDPFAASVFVYNNTVIGYSYAEAFSIAQVRFIDPNTGAYTLDDGTVTDVSWKLCGAAKGDYIEVVRVGANTVTRATSRVENVKITQITNASAFFANSYNNGQFIQSGATNVADYLNQAASKLTLGNYYTFYMDSKGNFFRTEVYSAPAPKTETVFFVKAFTIAGTTTTDEWGRSVAGKARYYAQCVTAEGEMVNFETSGLYMGNRGPVEIAFDSRGYAEFRSADSYLVERIAGADWSGAAITQFPSRPYYLTDDCSIIVMSQKDARKGAAEFDNLKVETIDALKGDFTGIDLYVAIPATTAAAKDIRTVWIDGAPLPHAEPVRPVADSYIYVTDPTQVGTMLSADGRTVLGTYNVYIDGVYTQIGMTAAPTTGFFTYYVKDGVYTLTPVDSYVGTVRSILLDSASTLLHNGAFSSTDASVDAKSIAGMKVVDLRIPTSGVAPVTDVAGLEALKTTVTLTVLMSSKGDFVGVIYVS